MQASLQHFPPWANDLFFLSIYSDQPAASLVTRKVLGKSMERRRNKEKNYFDLERKRKIDVTRYARFLQDKLSIDKINDTRRLPVMRDKENVLTPIANVTNVWDKNDTLPVIALFCNNYSHCYSDLLTNT